MAGHSKWANIKHRKVKQDSKRAKAFTRIIKDITIAAREGGGEIDYNPALRLAVQNAKGANMPKELIERAIKKGAGGEGTQLQSVTYEGYGPNGVAVFVEATTDNINRTVANVRAIFNKYDGSLGTNGSLSFIFTQKGIFEIDMQSIKAKDMEELELELIEAGAEDIEQAEDLLVVTTQFEDFGKMQKALEEMGIEVKSATLQRIPNTYVKQDVQTSMKILRFIEKFEEDDDVSEVYHNLELSEELEAELDKL
jgi:YebC/PmpR family DNA-binding regulatory protein